MKTSILAIFCYIFFCLPFVHSQTIYVDAQNGNDSGNGSLQTPFQSLEKAVTWTNGWTGTGSIVIKLLPGLYTLNDKVVIHPVRMLTDSMRFTLEAHMLPGDSLWSSTNMPVIQSFSGNNSVTQFRHSTGLLVASDHVTIRGLKFVGNAHPEVMYYYPITRENPALKDLEISQCYFVGEKNAAPIQGGIWAQGNDMNVNHCIFYGCRNAILFFTNIAGCSITHNIIYGAYESALWVGENQPDFEFSHNIISRCHFVWVNSHSGPQMYTLKNVVLVGNDHFLGKWNNDKYDVVEFGPPAFVEEQVVRTGKVELLERIHPEQPLPMLHLTPTSTGKELNAGVIKR